MSGSETETETEGKELERAGALQRVHFALFGHRHRHRQRHGLIPTWLALSLAGKRQLRNPVTLCTFRCMEQKERERDRELEKQ